MLLLENSPFKLLLDVPTVSVLGFKSSQFAAGNSEGADHYKKKFSCQI